MFHTLSSFSVSSIISTVCVTVWVAAKSSEPTYTCIGFSMYDWASLLTPGGHVALEQNSVPITNNIHKSNLFLFLFLLFCVLFHSGLVNRKACFSYQTLLNHKKYFHTKPDQIYATILHCQYHQLYEPINPFPKMDLNMVQIPNQLNFTKKSSAINWETSILQDFNQPSRRGD